MSIPDITVEATRVAKQKLERQITDAINQFQKTTGCLVVDVHFRESDVLATVSGTIGGVKRAVYADASFAIDVRL